VIAVALGLLAGAASAFDLPGTDGRVAVTGYVDGLAVVETDEAPDQDPQALLVLRGDAPLAKRLRVHLELRGRVGGPLRGGHPGFYNLVHTFQNRTPSGEASEAWVEATFRKADVRIGIQRFAWGKLDGTPPTDILNPADFHDPILTDWEERKIGVPAVWGRYYLPDVSRFRLTGVNASLAWIPFAVPSRLPLIQERWFPGTTIGGSTFVLDGAAVQQATGLEETPPDQVIPLTFQTRNHRPPLTWDAGGIGLRLGGTVGTSDVALYHYSGADTGPDIDLRSSLHRGVRITPRNVFGVRADNIFRQAHDVLHMVGGDFATTIGGATVRAEVADFFDRPFLVLASGLTAPNRLSRLPARRLFRRLGRRGWVNVPLGDLFVDLDGMEWGLGADYLWRGWLPLLQVNQLVFWERAPELVVHTPLETRITGSLRRSFVGDRLLAEIRGIYVIEEESWFVYPRVSYQIRDDLRLRIGYLAVGGPEDSLIGQYKRNDEVVFQARYSF
jgi:hypothetical protein